MRTRVKLFLFLLGVLMVMVGGALLPRQMTMTEALGVLLLSVGAMLAGMFNGPK